MQVMSANRFSALLDSTLLDASAAMLCYGDIYLWVPVAAQATFHELACSSCYGLYYVCRLVYRGQATLTEALAAQLISDTLKLQCPWALVAR